MFEFVSKVTIKLKGMVVIFLTLNFFGCRLNENIVDVSSLLALCVEVGLTICK
jgi:hypothetical protein